MFSYNLANATIPLLAICVTLLKSKRRSRKGNSSDQGIGALSRAETDDAQSSRLAFPSREHGKPNICCFLPQRLMSERDCVCTTDHVFLRL
jgi:hypothetical protein